MNNAATSTQGFYLHIHGSSWQLDLPRNRRGAELEWLCTRTVDHWVVIDDTGGIWAVRPTQLGAARVAGCHRRLRGGAPNHYARSPSVARIGAAELRALALTEARETLRMATETECGSLWNGGLGSRGADDALRVLRRAGRYADWHGLAPLPTIEQPSCTDRRLL